MRIVSGRDFKTAFSSVAEALAAAGWPDAPGHAPELSGDQPLPPARPGLIGRSEEDTSGQLSSRQSRQVLKADIFVHHGVRDAPNETFSVVPEAEGIGLRVAILAAVVVSLVMLLGAVGIRVPLASVSPAVVAGD